MVEFLGTTPELPHFPMDQQTKILEFISFCIEMTAERKGCSGQEVAKLFADQGIPEYLAANYEALHTQGLGYVLALIEELMLSQGVKA
jgi:Protein of unknown function (DUF3791)